MYDASVWLYIQSFIAIFYFMCKWLSWAFIRLSWCVAHWLHFAVTSLFLFLNFCLAGLKGPQKKKLAILFQTHSEMYLILFHKIKKISDKIQFWFVLVYIQLLVIITGTYISLFYIGKFSTHWSKNLFIQQEYLNLVNAEIHCIETRISLFALEHYLNQLK